MNLVSLIYFNLCILACSSSLGLISFTSFSLCLMQYRADARKQQQQQQVEESGSCQVSNSLRSATALADQDQRKALKFGFSSKGSTSKV